MTTKIVFACRSGATSSLIAHHLAKSDLLDSIVLESGVDSKKRKLNRIKSETRWWEWPIRLVDIAGLFVYQKLLSIKIKKYVISKIGTCSLPKTVPYHCVDDINNIDCMKIFENMQPCILVVFGTSILNHKTIEAVKGHIYNIHSGIVPKYRNVHSELWAFVNHDYQNIGTTIMHLDEGIDTGDIANQKTLRIDRCDRFFDIKLRNIELSCQLIVDVLTSATPDSHREGQDKTQQRFYPTPRIWQLLKLLSITIRQQINCITKPSSGRSKSARR